MQVSDEFAAKLNARIGPLLEDAARLRDGVAAQRHLNAEDGWVVVYTTTRVEGGPHDGRFVTMAYKPRGAGARTGKARQWVRVYCRAFSTRKAAKVRAMELWLEHSPKHRAKNPDAKAWR